MFDYLNFFHSLDRFGVRPGLSRIQALMSQLGNPEEKLHFVHVAGTNGKGSVCTFLSEILQAAGYKTGLFLSPFVIDFRERIQINSEMIDLETISHAAQKLKTAIDYLNEKDIVITEFEAVTAAAFLCFKEQCCDVVVLETGLGGRFDATNIISAPLVSVLTSISLDHTQVLGSTTAEIALEKCGIIKNSRPVVTSDTQKTEALNVIKKISAERDSNLSLTRKEEISVKNTSIFGSEFSYKGWEYKINLAGEHQIENAHLAVKAAEVLKCEGFNIQNPHIKKGLEAAKIPARIQILSQNPLIILDGSHNEGSTKALAILIRKHLPNKKILGLVGMMGDKDYEKSLENLAPLFSAIVTTSPKNPRAVDAKTLEQTAAKFCKNTKSIDSPSDAFEYAKNIQKNFDALVICGSLYLATDILNNID